MGLHTESGLSAVRCGSTSVHTVVACCDRAEGQEASWNETPGRVFFFNRLSDGLKSDLICCISRTKDKGRDRLLQLSFNRLQSPELHTSIAMGNAASNLINAVVAPQCQTTMARCRTAGSSDVPEWAQFQGSDHFCDRPQYALSVSETQSCVADRKSTRLNSSHSGESRMPSSA